MRITPPKVSIIIPCYNCGHLLCRALESVFNQDCDDWEAIVVNDGSTDNTRQVVESYANREELKIINQENGGVSKARNTGISFAEGKYILLLDADDWISTSYVSEAIEYLEGHPDCKAFIPMVQCHNSHGETLAIEGSSYSTYRNLLLYGQNIVFVYRKVDWEKIGGYDESMRNGIEDWEFAIRFFYGNPTIYNSTSIHYHYQRFSSEGSLSQSAGKMEEDILWYIYTKHKYIYKEYFGNPIFLARHKEQYEWADRRLPQLARKFQNIYQNIHNSIKKTKPL